MLMMQKVKAADSTNLRIEFMGRTLSLSLDEHTRSSTASNIIVYRDGAHSGTHAAPELWQCADLNVPPQLTYFNLPEKRSNDSELALLTFAERFLGLKLLPFTFREVVELHDESPTRYTKLIENATSATKCGPLPINCVFDYDSFVVMVTRTIIDPTIGDQRRYEHVIHGAWSEKDRAWLAFPANLFTQLNIENSSLATPFQVVVDDYNPRLATCRQHRSFYFNVIPSIFTHAMVTLPGVYGDLEFCGSVAKPIDPKPAHETKVGTTILSSVVCSATGNYYHCPTTPFSR